MRIVEQIFRSVWNQLPPETKRRIYTGLKNGDPKAIKDVASIFQIPYKDAMRYLGISMVTGAITAPKASASTKVNTKANTIKKLTTEEEAKLREQGRSDLISGSKSTVKQGLNYVSSDAYLNEMKKYVTPELLKSQATDLIVTALVSFLPGVPKTSLTPIINQAKKLGGSKGVQYVTNAVRNALVKSTPKAITTTAKKNALVKTNPNAVAKIQADKELYFPRRISKEEAAELSKDAIDGKVVYRDYLNASEQEIKDLFGMSKEEFKNYFGANDDNFLWEVKRFFDTYGISPKMLRDSRMNQKLISKVLKLPDIKGSAEVWSKKLPVPVYLRWRQTYRLPGEVQQPTQTYFLTGEVQKAAKTAELPGEPQALLSILRSVGTDGQKVGAELGVTGKEAPQFVKFIKDMYETIKNSPGYIKAMATGGAIAGGLGGLTLYDFWQAYKENGFTFEGLRTPMGKIIRNVLGYDGKDKLSKAAAKKMGFTDGMTEKQAADAELGLFSQDLIDSDIDEYFTGASGRKYHNKDGYIYDFATGRPVNIADAINDYTQLLEYEDQKLINQINNANQQLSDLQRLRDQGYAISDDQILQAQNNVDLLQSQRQISLGKLEAITSPDFDASGDLIEQYKSKVVQPQQQVQQAQAANQQRAFDDVYKAAFERIAQDTYNDLDNYYGPQQQQVDYYTYMQKVDRREVPYLSPSDFIKYQKMEYMKQMSPKIQQSALQYAQLASDQMYKQGSIYNKQQEIANLQKQKNFENWLNVNKFDAEQKKNLQDLYLKYLNYQNEVDRTNIQAQNAESTKQRAEAATEANKLKQQEIDIKKQMQPYQQMEYMGSSLSGASMGGLTPDQFINANPEVAKQVFPSAFQENNQQAQQQPKKQNFIMSIFNQFRGDQ